MPGDGAVMKDSGKASRSFTAALEPRDLGLERGVAGVMDFGLRLRRILGARRAREAARQARQQLGKFLVVAAAAALRFAGEARHALRDVGLEADALLLAVIADIDAGFLLFRHDVAHRPVQFRVEFGLVDLVAGLARDQQLADRLAARQAADMGGENPVGAQQHRRPPRLVLAQLNHQDTKAPRDNKGVATRTKIGIRPCRRTVDTGFRRYEEINLVPWCLCGSNFLLLFGRFQFLRRRGGGRRRGVERGQAAPAIPGRTRRAI